jgi:hypothetical protein
VTNGPPGGDWYKGIVTPIIAWGAIGIITGAGWLAFFVPSRLGEVDNNQKIILAELESLGKKLELKDAAYQDLRDRVIRLETHR